MAPALHEKGRDLGLSGLSGACPQPLSRPEARQAGLAALRARISRIESGGRVPGRRPVLPLGLAALDEALPGGGLPLGALHEIEGERAEWDDGVTLGFCLAILARLRRFSSNSGSIPPQNILWVSRWGDLYPPALVALGLDPGRFIMVRAKGEADLFWAMEEGLRCNRLAAVVGEVEGLDRLAGRRLQLAAEASGVTAFALHRRFRPRRRGRDASAALSRWRVTAAASSDIEDATFIGRPRWRLDLLRCRGAAPGSWQVEWDNAACGFSLAPALRDGSLAAQPRAKPTATATGAELIDFRQAV
ncbi:ImuA family protein [Pelagibius litoralis]|uniref:ImuA family protein n=1 Tax=Pelagibius litoralis TaxID=374515 RepID=UPI001F102CD7|nr:damage-inducible mutagenesis protein [Pelagibius litoralis]